MSSVLGSDTRPLRAAIVGSGPSGFYAAEAFFKSEVNVKVDMFDRLPAPFGLVRYGVAPDHESIKRVIKVYEKTAENPAFSFFGNVFVGTDISVGELKRYYDVIVFACGAETDRRLGIPGEDLPGSYTATEFVAWYNGHPEYRGREFDLSHEVAVIIGQGNVAVDVARILCKTVDELKDTDITAHALDVLAESRVKHIHMIGRRGPVQAAFTPPEIKEFGELEDCDPVVNAADLELNAASQLELDEKKNGLARKNFKILQEFSQRGEPTKSRRFIVHFYESPIEIRGDGKVEHLLLTKNALSGEAGRQKATSTGEQTEMTCGAFFRSVGYRGLAIDGVPFDESWGVFPNEGGRILEGGKPFPGLYAVGWIKRGPSGVIGTNKPDSIETVKNVLEDLPSLSLCEKPDSGAVEDLLEEKGVQIVPYEGWKRIDQAEIERGQEVGKPREKFVHVEDMIRVSRAGSDGAKV